MDKVTQPRVTIGLPVYNGADYLEEALESIVNQTFTGFELIITDNASTDDTAAICHRFAARDARIRYYRNPKNVGAAKNYNLSVMLARGEYFKWAAHDDLMASSLLEKSVRYLDDHPEAVMVYGRTILIDQFSRVIEYHDDQFNLRSSRPHHRLRQAFRSSAWCHPVFGLVRTDILRRTGMIGNFASSDKVLLAELAVWGQCHELPEHLAYRRLHSHNSTSTNTTDETMAAWFDPNAGSSVLAPRWQRLCAVAAGIRRAPLSLWDEILTFGEYLHFYLSLDRLSGATKDVRQVARWMRRTLFSRKMVQMSVTAIAGLAMVLSLSHIFSKRKK